MDQDLDNRLKELEKKVDEMSVTLKRIWNSYRIALWITVALIVIPLIGLAFVLPSYLKSLDLTSLV